MADILKRKSIVFRGRWENYGKTTENKCENIESEDVVHPSNLRTGQPLRFSRRL